MNDDFDIFVSYSLDLDRVFLKVIEDYFKKLHQKVFCYECDNIRFGNNIENTLEKLIRACSHVLVMVTTSALKSRWVEFEIKCANRLNRHLIAMYHKDFPKDNLPTELRDKLALKYKDHDDLHSKLEALPEGYWGYTAYIPAGGFAGGKIEFSATVPKACCQIRDRPMLFHVIDSLPVSLVSKVVVINQKDHAPDFISYVTSLEYSSRGNSASKRKAVCVETEEKPGRRH